MSDLIVVGFHGKHRAAEVLDQLQDLDSEWTIDLEDGVAAYRRDNGKFRVEQHGGTVLYTALDPVDAAKLQETIRA